MRDWFSMRTVFLKIKALNEVLQVILDKVSAKYHLVYCITPIMEYGPQNSQSPLTSFIPSGPSIRPLTAFSVNETITCYLNDVWTLSNSLQRSEGRWLSNGCLRLSVSSFSAYPPASFTVSYFKAVFVISQLKKNLLLYTNIAKL